MMWLVANKRWLLYGAFFLSILLGIWKLYSKGYEDGVGDENTKWVKANAVAEADWRNAIAKAQKEALDNLQLGEIQIIEVTRELAKVHIPSCPDTYAAYKLQLDKVHEATK